MVEAKGDDIIAGVGQSAAEMVADRIFNDRESSPTRVVFGSVTSGSVWKFLKLEGATLTIDGPE